MQNRVFCRLLRLGIGFYRNNSINYVNQMNFKSIVKFNSLVYSIERKMKLLWFRLFLYISSRRSFLLKFLSLFIYLIFRDIKTLLQRHNKIRYNNRHILNYLLLFGATCINLFFLLQWHKRFSLHRERDMYTIKSCTQP